MKKIIGVSGVLFGLLSQVAFANDFVDADSPGDCRSKPGHVVISFTRGGAAGWACARGRSDAATFAQANGRIIQPDAPESSYGTHLTDRRVAQVAIATSMGRAAVGAPAAQPPASRPAAPAPAAVTPPGSTRTADAAALRAQARADAQALAQGTPQALRDANAAASVSADAQDVVAQAAGSAAQPAQNLQPRTGDHGTTAPGVSAPSAPAPAQASAGTPQSPAAQSFDQGEHPASSVLPEVEIHLQGSATGQQRIACGGPAVPSGPNSCTANRQDLTQDRDLRNFKRRLNTFLQFLISQEGRIPHSNLSDLDAQYLRDQIAAMRRKLANASALLNGPPTEDLSLNLSHIINDSFCPRQDPSSRASGRQTAADRRQAGHDRRMAANGRPQILDLCVSDQVRELRQGITRFCEYRESVAALQRLQLAGGTSPQNPDDPQCVNPTTAGAPRAPAAGADEPAAESARDRTARGAH